MNKASETADMLLELILFEEVDLLLAISLMSMSIVDGKWAIFESLELIVEVESCLFANSLTGTTIQDSGIGERSDAQMS